MYGFEQPGFPGIGAGPVNQMPQSPYGHPSHVQSPQRTSQQSRGSSNRERRKSLKCLAEKCMKRLKYAHFKVEHGWAKHSLPEVENLYFRQQGQAAGPSSSPADRAGPHQSRHSSIKYASRQSPSTLVSRTAKSEIKNRRLAGHIYTKGYNMSAGDVFGSYGYAPPTGASADQLRLSSGSSNNVAAPSTFQIGTLGGAGNLPLSPPRTDGGGSPNDRFNTSGSGGAGGSVGGAKDVSPHMSRSGSGLTTSSANLSVSRAHASAAGTYADFWAKLGQASATQSPTRSTSIAGSLLVSPPALTAAAKTPPPTSAYRKRSAPTTGGSSGDGGTFGAQSPAPTAKRPRTAQKPKSAELAERAEAPLTSAPANARIAVTGRPNGYTTTPWDNRPPGQALAVSPSLAPMAIPSAAVADAQQGFEYIRQIASMLQSGKDGGPESAGDAGLSLDGVASQGISQEEHLQLLARSHGNGLGDAMSNSSSRNMLNSAV